jgi:hypothetical protein
MAKIESLYTKDSTGYFCMLFGITQEEIQPVLEFINAPQNLQQFLPAIDNLIEIFEVGQRSPLLHEFHLDEAKIATWKSTLEKIRSIRHVDLPPELQQLKPRKNVRPDGLIGDYSEYASLVASDPSYSENEATAIRYLHFIALGAAAGYREQVASGEVTEQTKCIADGMRKIRDLESPKKRPTFEIPDLRTSISLKACQNLIKKLNDVSSDKSDQEWADKIRGLLRAYSEARDGRGRYELELDKIGEIHHSPVQEEPDWASDTGNRDPSSKPFRLITYISRPDETSRRTLMKLGLSPDEYATKTAVAFNDPDMPPLAQHDARLGRLKNRDKLNSLIQASQALPDSWGTPTAYEIEQLVRQLSSEPQPTLTSISPDDMPALQAMLLLKLWTGRPLEELLILQLLPSFQNSGENEIVFIEDNATLQIPISTPSRQRGINPIDQALLQSSELAGRTTSSRGSILVKLPKTATSILQTFFQKWQQTKKRKTHRQPFLHSTIDFVAGIRAYLSYLNRQHATRWTDVRISLVMRQAILQSTGDQVFVYLLTKQELGHAVVVAHYQCTDVDYLAAVFHRAHAWIISTVSDGTIPQQNPIDSLSNAPAVGSPLAVSDTFVRELCNHFKIVLRSQLRQSPSVTTWINIHNALVAYIVHWLGFCSGYRAVRDPLHDPLELDQQTGILVISDKDDDFYRHTRVVCLPLSFVKQMDVYIEHLLSLATKLTGKSDLHKKIRALCQRYRHASTISDNKSQTLPFLFFLSPQLRVRNISPSTLAEFNPTDLPGNIDRHYLRSKLSALGAPGEYIDYFMGHWERGEEPYQKYSMVSPLQIGKTLQPYLEEITKACGWSVQFGLRGC